VREDAQGARGAPSGTLRLNLPLVYGREVVVPKLAALTRRYPELALELSFSDRYVDMVRERLDAVVRIGQLTDSTLVARRIGMQGMGMLQLPDYMATVAFKARRVVELLPAFRPPALAISLVLPSARQMTPRIRVLVGALGDTNV
jgi:DNA-binding transcriptional LysR family regulator